MSGILASIDRQLFLLRTSYEVTLGAAGGGADVVGYIFGLLGSIDPTHPSTEIIPGYLHELRSSTSSDFYFLLNGAVVPQDAFTSITVEGNVYTTASATFEQGADYTQWLWGDGSSRSWTAGMATQTRTVTLVL